MDDLEDSSMELTLIKRWINGLCHLVEGDFMHLSINYRYIILITFSNKRQIIIYL